VAVAVAMPVVLVVPVGIAVRVVLAAGRVVVARVVARGRSRGGVFFGLALAAVAGAPVAVAPKAVPPEIPASDVASTAIRASSPILLRILRPLPWGTDPQRAGKRRAAP
jgi:hypothetical protein